MRRQGRSTFIKSKDCFFQVGDVRLELLEPASDGSVIAQFLEKHGEGVHHVAFSANNIDEQLSKAKNAGCHLIHETPVKGAGDRQVAFLHPKSTHGVLTEFCSDEIGQKDKDSVVTISFLSVRFFAAAQNDKFPVLMIFFFGLVSWEILRGVKNLERFLRFKTRGRSEAGCHVFFIPFRQFFS